jgi:hypothetical protein
VDTVGKETSASQVCGWINYKVEVKGFEILKVKKYFIGKLKTGSLRTSFVFGYL